MNILEKILQTIYYFICLYILFWVTFELFKGGSSSFFSVCMLWVAFVAMNGYCFKVKIFERVFWSFVSVFVVVSISLQLLSLSIFSFILIVFFLPMYSALFRYASKSNPIWGEVVNGALRNESMDLLDDTLLDIGVITKTDTSPDQKGLNKTEVKLQRNDNLYLVEIIKHIGNAEKITNNGFPSLEAALNYIDNKTNFNKQDFYPLKPSNAQGLS